MKENWNIFKVAIAYNGLQYSSGKKSVAHSSSMTYYLPFESEAFPWSPTSLRQRTEQEFIKGRTLHTKKGSTWNFWYFHVPYYRMTHVYDNETSTYFSPIALSSLGSIAYPEKQ